MEETSLIKDFAIIMMVAGAMTLLFRKLDQPPILGYLLAGLLVGPYTFSNPPVDDVATIRLLADLGLILLLFGLGLEFSWSKIRQMGFSVIAIGVAEILAMISLGYGLGRLMGWPAMDSIFLGAALHISSSAIITKILRDSGKLELKSSRLIVGILVVEDFAAVLIITVLSGIASSGTADFNDVSSLLLKLLIFIVASLVFGAILIPKIIRFTHQFQSKEALLITSLGLCFAMALLAREIELSAAAGAFLVGALIGDTEHSEEITEVITPIRDMFAAIFFVAIGMLIDISDIGHVITEALIVSAVFILGKILNDTLASMSFGYDSRTSLEVGMGMPTMGEFSLAIAKTGADRGTVTEPLYPIIALAVAITSITAPFISRSTNLVANFFDRKSPPLLRDYFLRMTDWLNTLRSVLPSDKNLAPHVRHFAQTIILHLVILVVLIGTGTFALHSLDDVVKFTNVQSEIMGLIIGFGLILLSIPSMVIIWRSLRVLVDEVTTYIIQPRVTAKNLRLETLRILLRDSVMMVISIFVLLLSTPFIAALFSVGSVALLVPFIVAAFLLYLFLSSLKNIHNQLENEFRRTLLGEEKANISHEVTSLGLRQDIFKTMAYSIRLPRIILEALLRKKAADTPTDGISKSSDEDSDIPASQD